MNWTKRGVIEYAKSLEMHDDERVGEVTLFDNAQSGGARFWQIEFRRQGKRRQITIPDEVPEWWRGNR